MRAMVFVDRSGMLSVRQYRPGLVHTRDLLRDCNFCKQFLGIIEFTKATKDQKLLNTDW